MHVGPGESVTVSAIVVGAAERGVLWSVDEGTAQPGSLGSVDAQGNYTAPSHLPDPIVVRLIARCAADPGQFTDVLVHVDGISVEIVPDVLGLPVNRTAQLTARIFGAPGQSVTWSLDDDATHGTISVDGLFTAPATLPEPPTAVVRATSVVDPTLSGTASVQLTGPVTVVVSPTEATVVLGASIQLTSSAQGAPDTGVEWFLEPPGPSSGRVTSGGYYLSPDYLPDPPVVQVWARSHFDTLSRAAVTITLVRPPPDVLVMVTPSAALVATGSSRQFTATVENSDNPAWGVAIVAPVREMHVG
ncbi:MAG: Ig domain-containing protein, partial [Acidimicrobiaceae bacterium]